LLEKSFESTGKNLKSKKKFDREVFAGIPWRIKKVTPLLLLDVTEARRPKFL
jgi:hypothetical protein